ncbi:MAG: hypothetical protein JWO78_947 [Micavibrio sp.]|nr:hypothetical protein [Micavibrio sp.]
MNNAKLIKNHRRLAWIAGITFLLWAGTGILHPVMTWTNPHPAKREAPSTTVTQTPNIAAILRANHITEITGARQLDNTEIQVTLPDKPERLYFTNGKPVKDGDKTRAIELAQYYTGKTDPIRFAELIEGFSNKYPYINRFLPAWKITFDNPDTLTVYVETDTDRLASITNTRKVILQTIFQTVHTMNFLNSVEGLRVGLVIIMISTILAMGGLGIALRLCLKRPNGTKGLRKWHRYLAVIAWLPFFLFPTSGIFHVIMQSPLVQSSIETARPAIRVADLPSPPRTPAQNLRLVILPDNTALWHKNGDNDEALSLRIAARLTRTAGDHAEKITTFSNLYGFAWKRLPVWRIATADGGNLFIEPQTGTIAARTTSLETTENWTFTTFHKWQFLDPYIPTVQRDCLMIALVLTGMIMTLSGLVMLRRRR